MLPDSSTYTFVFSIEICVILAHHTLQIGKRLYHVSTKISLAKLCSAFDLFRVGINSFRQPNGKFFDPVDTVRQGAEFTVENHFLHVRNASRQLPSLILFQVKGSILQSSLYNTFVADTNAIRFMR